MNKPLSIALTLGALLLAAPAWARDAKPEVPEPPQRIAGAGGGARPVDIKRPLKPDARVSVSNVAGRIDVEAWDRNELHLTGTLAPEVEELTLDGDESQLEIQVELPEHAKRVGDTRLKLMLPARASLEVESVSADVSVRGLRGDVDVSTVSGDIRLEVESRRIEAASVSGDVTLAASSRDTEVSSVSGNVTVRGAKGKLRGESVSGDVTIDLDEVDDLSLESVSGDLEVNAELTDDAEVSIETLSGNVHFTLPRLPDGQLHMETFSGELRSSWTPGLPGDSKEFSQRGKGRGSVKLNSFSGDIEVKKK